MAKIQAEVVKHYKNCDFYFIRHWKYHNNLEVEVIATFLAKKTTANSGFSRS